MLNEQNKDMGKWKNLKLINEDNVKPITPQDVFDNTERALREAGISDEWLATKLKNIVEDAHKITKNWDIVPDYDAQIRALDMIAKLLKKYSNAPQINIVNAFSNIDSIR